MEPASEGRDDLTGDEFREFPQRAAMEPASEGRDDSSQNPRCLTCETGRWASDVQRVARLHPQIDLSSSEKPRLTSPRALPGDRATTRALAVSDNDRI